MPYRITLESILGNGWVVSDIDGVSEIPVKNVILKDGQFGSVFMNEEGIVLYNELSHNVGVEVEEGACFIAYAKNSNEMGHFSEHLYSSDCEDIMQMHYKYMERSKSFY